jgi:hypothetical protein
MPGDKFILGPQAAAWLRQQMRRVHQPAPQLPSRKPTAAVSLTTDYADLAADYDIVADGVLEDTGLTLDLPSAGDYILFVKASVGYRISGTGASTTARGISVQLYDDEDAADIDGTNGYSRTWQVDGVTADATIATVTPYTVASARTIRLKAYRGSPAPKTWELARVYGGFALTRISYLKVS